MAATLNGSHAEWACELRALRVSELERLVARAELRLRDQTLPEQLIAEARQDRAAYLETIARLEAVTDAAWWIERHSVSGQAFARGVATSSTAWRYPPAAPIPTAPVAADEQ